MSTLPIGGIRKLITNENAIPMNVAKGTIIGDSMPLVAPIMYGLNNGYAEHHDEQHKGWRVAPPICFRPIHREFLRPHAVPNEPVDCPEQHYVAYHIESEPLHHCTCFLKDFPLRYMISY